MAVKLETFIAVDADGADAYFFVDFIDNFTIVHQLHTKSVEIGMLR